MSSSVFESTLRFIKKYKPKKIHVIGGEVTEHPNFYEYLQQIIKLAELYKIQITIGTNGTCFLDDKKKSSILKLLESKTVRSLIVCTDKRFYPSYSKVKEALPSLQKISFTDDVNWSLLPLGRAKKNYFKNNSGKMFGLFPNCFYVYEAFLQHLQKHTHITLHDLFSELSHKQEILCIPQIDPSGNLRIGEFPVCSKIGNVDTPWIDITTLGSLKPCGKCGRNNSKYRFKNYFAGNGVNPSALSW